MAFDSSSASTEPQRPTGGYVGRPVTRLDGMVKASGAAKYAYEFTVPGRPVRYAWPVVSPVAKGTVTAIDSDRARKVDGVIDVLTHRNARSLRGDAEVPPPVAASVPDLLILQSNEVKYRGQIVAAVIAETVEAAREGASQVQVSIDSAPVDIRFPENAGNGYIPKVTNDFTAGQIVRGNPDAAYETAPVQFEACYSTPVQHAMPMEPHAATAVWSAGKLLVYASDQGPYNTGAVLSALLGMDFDDVNVTAQYVGGGFGAKAAPRPPIMLAVLAAELIDAPVKVALNRPLSAPLVTYRTPTRQRVRFGATEAGKINALIHESAHLTSQLLEYTEQTVSAARVMYDAEHCRTTATVVPLNVPTPGWVRAPGETPGMFALESAVDELAWQLKIDPIELRRINEPARDPETGLPFSSRSLLACLDAGAERFGWQPRDYDAPPRRDGDWLIGTGVAAATYPYYVYPSTAAATARPDATFLVEVGGVDIGTGARTALHQIAADALGVAMERVELVLGESRLGAAPYAGGSMGTASWGQAIHSACKQLTEKVGNTTSDLPPDGLRVVADTTDELGDPDVSRHTFGAHFAELRVHSGTGEVRLERMLGVFAAGRVINPRTARSQVIGAMTMGIGMALMEGGELDSTIGGFVHEDLVSYHVPAHADVAGIEAVFLDEVDNRLGPLGGKGIGEPGIVGAAAAVTNALAHATRRRYRDLPAGIDQTHDAVRHLRRTTR